MGRPKKYGPKTLAEDAGVPSDVGRADESAEAMPAVKRTYRITHGRPTNCTPEITRAMAELRAAGVSMPVAAKALGIPQGTWSDWNMYGRRDIARGVESPYAAWWSAMEEAEASCEANMARMVMAAAVHDWKAALAILERRWPERWCTPDKRPNRGNQDDLSGKSKAELEKLLADLREGKALPASTLTDEPSEEHADEESEDSPSVINVQSTAVDVE